MQVGWDSLRRQQAEVVAQEFALGRLLAASAAGVGRGEHGPWKMTTTKGSFAVRKSPPPFEAELYATVAQILNARGVRQARPMLTTDGRLIASTGHTVAEWLPGSPLAQSTDTQVAAVMAMLARYDWALADVTVPEQLFHLYTPWADVVRPSFLLHELLPLLQRFSAPDIAVAPVHKGLQMLSDATDLLEGLPSQVVHGDVAPDNVLFDDRQLVAIIDFTPHAQHPIFAVSSALYWFCLHRAIADGPSVGHALDAYVRSRAQLRPDRPSWSPSERDVLAPMLVREALRRLATPLAVAATSGVPPSRTDLRHRHQALERALLAADSLAE